MVCPGSGSHRSGKEGPCVVKHRLSSWVCRATGPPPHRAAGGSGVQFMISLLFKWTFQWPRDLLTQ